MCQLSLFQNLGIIYYLLPFIDAVDNKFGLLFSILIGSKNHKIKTKGYVINFTSSQFMIMMDFVGLLMFCTSHEITPDRKIHLTLDLKNTFTIPIFPSPST